MGFRYILGRESQGNSQLILKDIKEQLNKADHKKLILIVPEQFTLQAEKNLIEKLNLPGIIDIEVLSFTRLAHNVLNEVGGLTRIHINEQGKSMVLRKIIDELEENLTIYKKASRKDGFILMLSELLTELKQHDVLPTDLLNRLEKLNKESILFNKLQDIAAVYDKFNQYLQGQYVDSEDNINLLIERMNNAKFLRGAEIWIDGFHTFTPQTYRVIEKLSTVVKQITITISMDRFSQSRDGDLFKVSQHNLKKLNNIAIKNGLAEEIIDLSKEKNDYINRSPEINHIEQELYAYPYKKYSNEVNDIEIFAGLNLQSEIENVASQIVGLVRDKGYRWNDIAVVCNSLDNYGSIIKRVFSEYNIPFFLDQKRSIMHNPLIEIVLSTLAIVKRGYRYEDVFRFFKTGFSGIDIESYEKLENYVLQYGIKGNRWLEEFKYGDEAILEDLNLVRERFIEPFKSFEKKIKGKKTVEEITRALYEYLNVINLHEQLEAWIDTLKSKGNYEYVNENTQIWNILMDIFDQMVEIIGEQKVNTREYINILESGFLSLEIGIIPTTIDQVLIGNIYRSRSHDIKALFVLGANDGILPSGKDRDGILSDEERINIEEIGFQLGLNSEKKTYEEKFMIYSALSKPSEYLWISYSLADQEGKALRPSILIDRFKKIFSEIKVNSDVNNDINSQLKMLATPNSTFKYLVENMRLNVDGKRIEDLWWNTYKWYSNQKEWDEKRESVIKGLFHNNQVDYIDKSNAKKIYNSPIRSSVSRLEQFVNCPFAHFVKYGLKPKERKIYQVEAPDMGEIFHNSLELFTKKLADNKIDWRQLEKNQSDQIIDDVVDVIIPNHGNGVMLSTNRYKYLVKRLKRISRRAVWTLTNHIKRSGFEPVGYEIGFGLNQMYPPIEIELPDGEKIFLEGRIDRVDIFENEENSFIKVIDYKSGNKEFSLSDVYNGLQIQLMVYLDAILSSNSNQNNKQMKPAGIFYFKIDDPMVNSKEKVVDLIEKEIRKKLKMKGIALKDVKIVREMDQLIDGYSEVIPVGLKKTEEFYDKSSAIHDIEFISLIDHVRKLIKEISNEIVNGKIRIEPLKNGKQIACNFCPYQAVCQFDNSFMDNSYKNIKKLSDKEVISNILGEKVGTEDGNVD